MTWCNKNDSSDDEQPRSDQLHHHHITSSLHHKEISLLSKDAAANNATATTTAVSGKSHEIQTITCTSCGHNFPLEDQGGIINDLPGLPAGVKFDPSDIEILEHLEAKVLSDSGKLHPLIDEFIPTIQGENGICYTHPEKLPGVSKDGQVRHFFHRPSKAYTTGTRKRRKVHTDDTDGGNETRWHKTGKTRAVFSGGTMKGFKKILVLYTNYGRQRKPEKTNWVMHQYHLGNNEEEKDGELVASKVFYQTQPRQCGTSSSNLVKNNLNIGLPKTKSSSNIAGISSSTLSNNVGYYDYSPPPFISYDHAGISHNLVVQGGDESSFIQLPTKQRKT